MGKVLKVSIKARLTSFAQGELHKLLDLLDRIVAAVNHLVDVANKNPYLEGYEDITITTPAAPDEEFSVTLATLGKKPSAYHVIRRDKAGHVYDARPEAWAVNKLFLKCSVVSATITLRVG